MDLTSANVSSSVLSDVNYLSTGRGIDEDVSLRSDAAIGLSVEKHDPVKTLFGAAGNSLGEIRTACFGAIEFGRKIRI